jgi:molecular chaperone GrpE (heat shock protein)
VNFEAELEKLLAREQGPLPRYELVEVLAESRTLLEALNKRQADLSLQVEEIYDLAKEADARELREALNAEKERLRQVLGVALGLSDMLEHFCVYAGRSGSAELEYQGSLLWQNSRLLLETCGIARLGEAGESLNPALHTVQSALASELPKEQIIQVLQSGYAYFGRLVRKAVVVVSKGEPDSERKNAEPKARKGLEDEGIEPEDTKDEGIEPEYTEYREDEGMEPEDTEYPEDESMEPEDTEYREDEGIEPHDTEYREDEGIEPEDTEYREDESMEPEDTEYREDEGMEPEDTEYSEDEGIEPEDTEYPEDEGMEPEDTEYREDESIEPEDTEYSEDESIEPEDTEYSEDESMEPEDTEYSEDESMEPEDTEYPEDEGIEPEDTEYPEDEGMEPHDTEGMEDENIKMENTEKNTEKEYTENE